MWISNSYKGYGREKCMSEVHTQHQYEVQNLDIFFVTNKKHQLDLGEDIPEYIH